jgi:class 3 adenylate cyclase
MNSKLPSGTVTFLFTDIESSTRLWQENPQAMSVSHARHDAIVREAIEANNGYIFQIVGDSFSAAFHNAIDGLHAALAAQRGLTRVNDEGGRMKENLGKENSSFITHPSSLYLKVRMGLHTGTAEILPDGKYEGYATIASTQRVMSAAHGGQTLLTQTTHDLLQNALPDDVTLRDMGEHRLKDLRAPLRLYQVNSHDLTENFPTIKSLDTQPNKLPVQLTSFVGREKEIAEIKASFSASRLVTLTGSGGTGRLAFQSKSARRTYMFSNGLADRACATL